MFTVARTLFAKCITFFLGLIIISFGLTVIKADTSEIEYPKETDIAISVGGVAITFFELAQLLAFPHEGNAQSCALDQVDEALDAFIEKTIDVALGQKAGICDSDIFRSKVSNAQQFLLWQAFSESDAKMIISKQNLEEDDFGNYTVKLSKNDWAQIDDQFALPELKKDGDELTLKMDGKLRDYLHIIINQQLKMKPRPDLETLFTGNDAASRVIIKWETESEGGTYSLGDFAEDYNGMLLYKVEYSQKEVTTLVYDLLFSRKLFEQAKKEGVDRKKELMLGFPTVERRYTRSFYYKWLKSEINLPDESVLKDFFYTHIDQIKVPQKIELMEIRIPISNPETMARHLYKTIATLDGHEIESPVLLDLGGSKSRKTITGTDNEFPDVLKYLNKGMTPFGISSGYYSFKKILKVEGEENATFQQMRVSVEEKWKEDQFQQKLKALEKDFVDKHTVTLYPNIKKIICSDYFYNLKLDHVKKREKKMNLEGES